ncbi:respiratory nitrate reductase subunit beta [Klebsiella michiganensis]|uniref:Respiratory nitrate reductase subunit beta n=1 Tax=Klebsiella michiganensis TaxID=1134687 RepID=A0A7H4MX33_9ENTR|nr:respiratory nitrate reductase subunit beta [Klebsiella michiganensis]
MEGGWIRKINGKLQPRMGNRAMLLGKIFANPHLPGIDDYYEPFDYDYQNLHNAPESKHQPIARPRSLITGQRMEKITSGPNWEEILGGEFEKRAKDQNFENMQKAMYGQFENTFMMYLPRLCEHCLNPACVATCPSGAIYKREEDGIVLIDQDKCRGWRMCITGWSVQENLLQLEEREIGEVHLLLPAYRIRDADRLLGNLRGAYSLPRRAAV